MSAPDKCSDDVYRNGISLGVFAMSKDEAEEYCKTETKRTGRLHDWHYFGGRVHVKYLPELGQGEDA